MRDHTQPSVARTASSPAMRGFFRRRLQELGYGGAFSGLFLLCQSPLNALVVDDIRILSRLGEPLYAEVAISTAGAEQLARNCFSTTTGAGELPALTNVQLALTRQLGGGVLTLRTARPLREPISELVLRVKCPGVPTVVRTFLVMVDPPARTEALPAAVAVGAAGAATTPVTSARRNGVNSRNAGYRPAGAAIAPGSRYTVRSGDMLSTIASRVTGRPDWSVWPLAQRIFAANPGAFLLGNPNMIAEGAVIDIPQLHEVDFSNARPLTGIAATVPGQRGDSATAPVVAPASAANSPVARTSTAGAETVAARRPAPAAATAAPANSATSARAPAAGPQRAVSPPVPATAAIAAIALPAMQLTAALSGESNMKLRLRMQGITPPAPVAPGNTDTAPVAAGDAPVQPQPRPQPVAAAVDQRVALPEQSRGSGWFNWLVWLGGILVAFLLGGLVAASVLRNRIKARYDRDLSEALRVRERKFDASMTAPAAAAAPVATPPAAGPEREQPSFDVSSFDDLSVNTVETEAITALDLELAGEELAQTGEPETLELTSLDEELDLELPGDDISTGRTGQQEVDLDLLERAYSEAYEFETPAPGRVTGDNGDAASPSDDVELAADERYYHLENRDPADAAPLPIELGEEEMSGDSAERDKVVKFPKHSSSA